MGITPGADVPNKRVRAMNDKTGFLYARPSFLEGIARIMDMSGTLNEYNRSESPEEADTRALRSDWYAVGDDLRTSITAVGAEIKHERLGRVW